MFYSNALDHANNYVSDMNDKIMDCSERSRPLNKQQLKRVFPLKTEIQNSYINHRRRKHKQNIRC